MIIINFDRKVCFYHLMYTKIFALFYINFNNFGQDELQQLINPRRHKLKKVTRRHKGGGSMGPLPSTFDTIHPID